MPQHDPGQWRDGENQPAEIGQVPAPGYPSLLEPVPGAGADPAVDHRRSQVFPQQGVLHHQPVGHPPQELPLFGAHVLVMNQPPEDIVIPPGQGRVVLEGADPVAQADQVIDLDPVHLHGRGCRQPQGGRAWPKFVTDGAVESAEARFGLTAVRGGRVLSAGIMRLVDQGNVESGRAGQLRPPVLPGHEPGGDDGQVGGIEALAGDNVRLGEDVFVPQG